MQGSYKYQFLSHWFNPTLNRTPSLLFQKQTLYPIGHLGGNNFFCVTILPPSKQVHHRRSGKCVVDTLTFENAIRVLNKVSSVVLKTSNPWSKSINIQCILPSTFKGCFFIFKGRMHCMLMDLLHGFEVLSTTEETLFNSRNVSRLVLYEYFYLSSF